jgi:hypothetical protein
MCILHCVPLPCIWLLLTCAPPPRCEDPFHHHRRLPPPSCLALLLPLHLLLPPLEDSGSSSACMPRWSSAGRVTPRERDLDGLQVNAGFPRGGRSSGVDLAGRGRRARRAWRHAADARCGGPHAGRARGAAASLRWRRSRSACCSRMPPRPPSRFGRATGGRGRGAVDPAAKNGGVAG